MIARTAIALIACALALASPLASTAAAQTGTPVNVCGTMTAYRPATSIAPGQITVGGEQLAIDSNARQNISPDARVGSEVCLTGAWIMSQTVGRTLVEVTVVPRSQTAAPRSPTPATPSQLPSTSAAPATPQRDPLPLVVLLSVAGLAALLILLRMRRA